jgi:hypothetical protein
MARKNAGGDSGKAMNRTPNTAAFRGEKCTTTPKSARISFVSLQNKRSIAFFN